MSVVCDCDNDPGHNHFLSDFIALSLFTKWRLLLFKLLIAFANSLDPDQDSVSSGLIQTRPVGSNYRLGGHT